MRIGIVLSSVPSYSETFFTTKIDALTKAGHAVYLFAPGKVNKALPCARIAPFPVFKSSLARFLAVSFILPFTFLRAPVRVVRFWKWERESGTSKTECIKKLYLSAHILSQTVSWLHFGFATIAIGREQVARTIGAKMAVSFRGYDLNVYPLKHPGCYTRLWARVDRVHSISHYLIAKAVGLGLSPDVPYQIISPALRFDSRQEMRKGSVHDSVRILTVARLSWIKGLPYGIRAMALLRDMKIPVHYTIIGDGPEYEHLLYEVAALDLNGVVELTGRRDHSETLLAMAESDLYLQPSLNEGFCNAVLEAQAAGCLCIASDVGGLPENILDGVTGWLVPPRRPDLLAETISRVIQMAPAERMRIVQHAVDRAYRDFALAAHIEQWANFYK